MTAATTMRRGTFYGWRVVAAAFVLAIFGWGIGFFGPPIFLSVITTEKGWSLGLVSTAVTVHFLAGAAVGATLPIWYRRFGIAAVTKAAAVSVAVGIVAWACAAATWQLFVAALFSGVGWGAMSAAAINAIVSPWFVRTRPAALAMAYNGGSVGGVIFSPLWVASIGTLGFPLAAATVGVVMVPYRVAARQRGLCEDAAADGTGARRRCARNARHRPSPARPRCPCRDHSCGATPGS